MFKTVLLATDLSSASDAVVSVAGQLRKLGTHTVTLFHALGPGNLEWMTDTLRSLYQPRIEEQKAILKSFGYKVSVVFTPGKPEAEIARYAAENEVSLIVAGSHGSSLSKEVLLSIGGHGMGIGGIAFGIVSTATVPVLIIPLRMMQTAVLAEVPEEGLFENLLYPTDFSDTADRAFEIVTSMVGNTEKGRVTLFHVQDKERMTHHLQHRLEEFNRIDHERLERLSKSLEKNAKFNVEKEIVYGSSIQEILKKSSEDYTLIVMGSQGRGYISEIFLGSVSHNVVRHSKCPVLLVPAIR